MISCASEHSSESRTTYPSFRRKSVGLKKEENNIETTLIEATRRGLLPLLFFVVPLTEAPAAAKNVLLSPSPSKTFPLFLFKNNINRPSRPAQAGPSSKSSPLASFPQPTTHPPFSSWPCHSPPLHLAPSPPNTLASTRPTLLPPRQHQRRRRPTPPKSKRFNTNSCSPCPCHDPSLHRVQLGRSILRQLLEVEDAGEGEEGARAAEEGGREEEEGKAGVGRLRLGLEEEEEEELEMEREVGGI